MNTITGLGHSATCLPLCSCFVMSLCVCAQEHCYAINRCFYFQSITDLFAARPRYDPDKSYFTELYRLECECLRANQLLVQNFLTKLLTDEREYNQRVCRLERCRVSPFSPAYPLITKQLVCLVGDHVTTVPIHIMETNSSLSMLSRLSSSVMYALSELVSC